MHILYLDESGDPGPLIRDPSGKPKNSQHFILTGLIVNQDRWRDQLKNILSLRRAIKNQYGLNIRTEIHASELVRVKSIKEYKNIRKRDRMKILSYFLAQLPSALQDSKVIHIYINKETYQKPRPIQETAFDYMLNRYSKYLTSSGNDKGIVVSDTSDEKSMRKIMRRMREYNPIPSKYGGTYSRPLHNLIEDPILRDSKNSYFIQACDAMAFSLYLNKYPKGSLRKYNADLMFNNITPLALKSASGSNDKGVVNV